MDSKPGFVNYFDIEQHSHRWCGVNFRYIICVARFSFDSHNDVAAVTYEDNIRGCYKYFEPCLSWDSRLEISWMSLVGFGNVIGDMQTMLGNQRVSLTKHMEQKGLGLCKKWEPGAYGANYDTYMFQEANMFIKLAILRGELSEDSEIVFNHFEKRKEMSEFELSENSKELAERWL